MNERLKYHLDSINEILSKEKKAFLFLTHIDSGIMVSKNITDTAAAELMYEYLDCDKEVGEAFTKICSEYADKPIKDISKAE